MGMADEETEECYLCSLSVPSVLKVINPSKTPAYVQVFKACKGSPFCDFDECSCASGPAGLPVEIEPDATVEVVCHFDKRQGSYFFGTAEDYEKWLAKLKRPWKEQ